MSLTITYCSIRKSIEDKLCNVKSLRVFDGYAVRIGLLRLSWTTKPNFRSGH